MRALCLSALLGNARSVETIIIKEATDVCLSCAAVCRVLQTFHAGPKSGCGNLG